MRPIFKDALVHGLSPVQVLAAIGGYAAPEDVVVAALDDIDRVDLDIAQMLDGGLRCARPGPERLGPVQPLGAEPDIPGPGLGQVPGGLAGDMGHGAGWAESGF